jgi:hypothetical protein
MSQEYIFPEKYREELIEAELKKNQTLKFQPNKLEPLWNPTQIDLIVNTLTDFLEFCIQNFKLNLASCQFGIELLTLLEQVAKTQG